jgi:GH35 family endo-1,4-beta-xylanase
MGSILGVCGVSACSAPEAGDGDVQSVEQASSWNNGHDHGRDRDRDHRRDRDWDRDWDNHRNWDWDRGRDCHNDDEEKVVAAGCGYELTIEKASSNKHGYLAKAELKNKTGAVGTSFELLLDVDGGEIRNGENAKFEETADGYVVTEPKKLKKIKRGDEHDFQFQGKGSFDVTPYVISVNGVKCDPEAPTVSLAASDSFMTSSDTLTLTATAADNISVRKVVFTQDGEVIAVDTEAPYVLEVDVTSALNGRHVYAATAHDPSGNSTTSNSERLLVAIDNKFLGTAAAGAPDYTHLLSYFDQITPGNAGKWGSVEATRDSMNWTELDTAYEFAKQNGLRFKMHTMIWGQQQPSWLASLTPAEQREEIEEWFAAVAARYPDLEMIDLVNEPLHAPPAYAAALGGAGATGWDWLITSFELGRQYFPNAELILNDYNILILPQFTNDYLNLINLLKDRGLIDGIGEQAHFLETADLSVVAQNLDALAATGLPIYISELDVNYANDARHANRLKDLFTLFWSHPSVVGVTHWGHEQGRMWRDDAHLVLSNGAPRVGLEWMMCFTSGQQNCTVPVYVPQPRVGDAAGITLQAEDFDAGSGLLGMGDIVAYTDDGDWESFERVSFQNTWDTIAIRYAKGNAGPSSASIYLDSMSNAPIVTVALPQTAGWGTSATQSVPFPATTGEHTVFVKYNGGFGVGNIDSIAFSSSALGPNIIANGDFESNSSGWFSWNGTVSTTTTSAQKGTHALLVSNRPGNGPAATTITSAVTPGTSYQVSMWVSIANAATANVNVTQKIRCNGGSDQYSWLVAPTAVQQGQWVELKGTLAVPNCALSEVTIYAEGPPAGVDLLVDNVTARAPNVTNLIPDGTFESSVGSWFSWNGTLSRNTTRAHGGAASLLSTNRTGNGPVARSLMGLIEPNKSYQLSMWVSIGNAATANVNITRKFTCQGQADSYSWVVNPTAVADGSWVKLSGTLAVPDCTLTDALIYAEGPGAGVDIYVDDVSLTK